VLVLIALSFHRGRPLRVNVPAQAGAVWTGQRSIDAMERRALMNVELVSGLRAAGVSVLLEEHVIERLELATIRLQHMVERLAQVGGLAHVDACDARVPDHGAISASPAVTRTSNQVTNPSSTFGSPKDNSVSTITRSTTDALAIARACQR
jgi:hypothetical protein